MEAESSKETFWNDQLNAQKTLSQISDIKQEISENITSDIIIDEDIKIEEKSEILIEEKKRKNTKKKKVDEDN